MKSNAMYRRLFRTRSTGIILMAIAVLIVILCYRRHIDTSGPELVQRHTLVGMYKNVSLTSTTTAVTEATAKYPTATVKTINDPNTTETATSEDPVTKEVEPSTISSSLLNLENVEVTNDKYWRNGYEELIENSTRVPRALSPFEESGSNIMFTIRTGRSIHKRLSVLFDTWFTVVNASTIFIVTDGEDAALQKQAEKIGAHYVKTPCEDGYKGAHICCKTGEEIALAVKPENSHFDWLCHIDDDIYIIMNNLVKLLSLYDPKKESVYLGRPKTSWKAPTHASLKQKAFKLKDDQKLYFHYAYGALYCFSRPMLEKIKPWLAGGSTMMNACNRFDAVEDRTVGQVVELLVGERLSRTYTYMTHNHVLAKELSPNKIKDQIAINYGCGHYCVRKRKKNAVKVPNAKFSYKQDPTSFKSVHCLLFPSTSFCNK